MTKIPSAEEKVAEFASKVQKSSKNKGFLNQNDLFPIRFLQAAWLREALTADRLVLLTEFGEMIDRHDPNVKMKRETNPAYWGNTLRAELDELIKATK